jgi:putative transposase
MNYNPNNHHRRSIRLKGYDYSQAGAYFITICCQNRECRFGKIVVGTSLADAQMELNEYGTIACHEWMKLPERFQNFELDVFQIMPNHMHGIIVLNDVGTTLAVAPAAGTNKNAGSGFTPTQNDIDNTNTETENVATEQQLQQQQNGVPQQKGQPQGLPLQITGDDNVAGVNRALTVGDIVGAYKSLVANACLDVFKSKNEMMGKLWQRNYHEHIIRNEQSYQTISDYIINNPKKWNDDKFYKQ